MSNALNAAASNDGPKTASMNITQAPASIATAAAAVAERPPIASDVPDIGSARPIRADQPVPHRTVMPRQQHGLELYQWWRLPSGQVVEVRRIVGTSTPECVVRNLNDDGEMASGEYNLTLRFLVTRAKKVKR